MESRSMPPKRLLALVLGWVALVTGLHLALNVDWAALLNELQPRDRRKLNIAFIPVT